MSGPEAARIRRARLPQDASAILAIDTSFDTTVVLAPERRQHGFALVETPARASKRFPLDDLQRPDRAWDLAWVAETSNRIVGFAAARFAPWNARLVLWHFYVDRPVRGRGVGRALFEAIHTEARRLRARHIWLETSHLNAPGVAVYEALGFEFTGLDLTLYDGTPAEGEFALFLSREIES